MNPVGVGTSQSRFWRKLAWYWHRLQVMSPEEVLARCTAVAQTASLYLAYRRPPPVSTVADGFAQATRCLFAHELPFLPVADQPESPVPAADEWHTAPDTGRRWPRRFFATLDYRAGNPVGDARLTWERSRLQQLVDDALRCRQTQDPDAAARYARRVTDTFDSWFRANPHLCGIHYVSAMECGLRVLALATAFDLIRDRVSASQWQALGHVIVRHATLIHRRLSRFSSAGNHTVAEAAGLICAGVLYGEHAEAAAWRESGREHLEHELLRQILPDGGGLEQASSYLRFVAELGFIANRLLRCRDEALSAPVRERIDQALVFLDALACSSTASFQFGDDDGGHALSRHFAPTPSRDRAPWSPGPRHFPHAGATRIDSAVGKQRMQLWFQHNPLGMPPLFGHGHAGCLSLQLAMDGSPVLIDCGTYGYNIADHWRRYFRGTSAHNTVCVDGEDQSQQLGNFQWARDIPASILIDWRKIDDTHVMVAAHQGYKGVVHIRALLLKPDRGLAVWDCLQGSGRRRISINWHLDGPCRRLPDGSGFGLAGDLALTPPAGADTALYYESKTPCAGWRSPGYGRVEGAYTVSSQLQGNLPLSALTRFELTTADPDDAGSWKSVVRQVEAMLCANA